MNNELISIIKSSIDNRRTNTQDWWAYIPIEDGVMITREDVQDYMSSTGLEPEEAYAKLKSYWNQEIIEL